MKSVDSEWMTFVISIGVFIVYLVFSAMTEMGTKIPDWLRKRNNQDGKEEQ